MTELAQLVTPQLPPAGATPQGGGSDGGGSGGGAPVTPQLPGAGATPQGGAPVTPQLPGAGATPDGGAPVMPQLPGAGATPQGGAPVTPKLPGDANTPSMPSPSLPGATPSPAAPTAGGNGNGLNVTIVNPQNLPKLPAGQNELKLVIQPPQAPTAAHGLGGIGGIGMLEIFFAIIAALLIAPLLQRESGRWLKMVNAIDFVQRNGVAISLYLLIFTTGWIVFMIILPQLYMFDFSFRFNLSPADIGGPKDVYTLKNYAYLIFGRPDDPDLLNWLHLQVFVKTIVASVIVTILNFAMCYPIAYFMAQSVKGRSQRLLFLCLLLPFWVNEILRAFAFKLIFAEKGIVNDLMLGLGIWNTPYDFLRADVALYTGLTYAYILLMVFPLYNAIESLDHNQVEAARDMGASWARIHYRVVMPHAKPGIASGCTMVFMLTAGALAAPNILGGPSSLWFTQIIYQWYNTGGNWPQGSAYAFVLLVACIIFVRVMMRIFKVGLGDIAKR